jgi:DNA-binding NarL/FixJ family response regulator
MAGTVLDPTCYEALVGAPNPRALAGLAPRIDDKVVATLTPREVEVLRELARGLGNRQVAKTLVISEKTVEHHLEHIYGKLGVSTRTSAVVFAIQNRIV